MTNKICFESRNGHLCQGLCDGEYHQWRSENDTMSHVWRSGHGGVDTHVVHKEIGNAPNQWVGIEQLMLDLRKGDLERAKRPVHVDLGAHQAHVHAAPLVLGELFSVFADIVSEVPVIGGVMSDLNAWLGTLVASIGPDVIMDALRLDRPIHDTTVEIGEPTSIFDAPSGTILDGFIGGPVIMWDDNPLISDTFDRAMPSVTAYDTLASREFEFQGQLAGIGFGTLLGELVEAPPQSITMYDREWNKL